MSAYTNAVVRCNAPKGACQASVESGDHDGSWVTLWTKAEARAEARKRGWLVRVHHDGIPDPRGLFDFCPDHRPDRKPQEG